MDQQAESSVAELNAARDVVHRAAVVISNGRIEAEGRLGVHPADLAVIAKAPAAVNWRLRPPATTDGSDPSRGRNLAPVEKDPVVLGVVLVPDEQAARL